jgi:hypothetical protein
MSRVDFNSPQIKRLRAGHVVNGRLGWLRVIARNGARVLVEDEHGDRWCVSAERLIK